MYLFCKWIKIVGTLFSLLFRLLCNFLIKNKEIEQKKTIIATQWRQSISEAAFLILFTLNFQDIHFFMNSSVKILIKSGKSQNTSSQMISPYCG